MEAVENCPDPVLKQNCKQLLGNDYTNAAVQFIADAQTAAKDAEHDKHIAEFQRAIYEACKAVALECGQPDHAIDGAGSDGDEIEFTVTEVKQAFNLLRESKEAAERERDSLRAENAALKAGKDGQQ